MTHPFASPTRRQLLAMIGKVAGATAMYQSMTSLGFAAESGYKGQIRLQGARNGSSVIVLGAGLGGLTAAYELRKAGYKVKVLEYQNRGGGRSWTIRGGDRYTELGGHEVTCDFVSDGYLNPGPWRLPIHHYAVFDYCRRFGVAMQPFIMKNDKAFLHNSKHFGGRPQRIGHVEKDIRGHTSELLAKAVNQGALDETVSLEDREKLLEGLKGWGVLDKNYRYVRSDDVGDHRGWDVLPGGGLMPKAEPSTPLALSPLLQSELWKELYIFNEYGHEPAMFEPTGGMGKIGDAFTRECRDLIQFNARVTRIKQDGNGVTVHYQDLDKGGTEQTATADWCVCNIPLSILAQLEVDCSDAMRKAIAAVPYASAYKVALEFKRRFWEQDDWIVGGISYTDLPITQVDYPSYGLFSDGPGVIQAAYHTYTAHHNYTYSWNTLTPKQRILAALQFGRQIHPQYDTEYMSGTSWAWHRSPWTLGCYGQWTDDLRDAHYKTLCEIDNRLVLVGEHCSHIPAWQEGAILSGLDAIKRLDSRENA